MRRRRYLYTAAAGAGIALDAYLLAAGTPWPDVVNGTFEMAGGFFILLSVLKLYEDKLVRGVSWVHSCFFATWGYWNLFYYPHLDQWVSFWGGVGIVSANTLWMVMMLYYLWAERARRERWRDERAGNRWTAGP